MNLWRCPLCSSSKGKRLFDITDFERNQKASFSIHRCLQCGLFSISPRPEPQEILSLYPEDYQPYQEFGNGRRSLFNRGLRHRHFQLRCRAVNSSKIKGRRLVDLGCGTGDFLSELLNSGKNWQAVGIEINPIAVRKASSRGLEVRLGELSNFGFLPASFDVITLWDVIEHLSDPQRTIEEIHRLLRPGGYLFISTPNGASLQAKFWNKYWTGWDIPRHLQVFTPGILCHFLGENGFILQEKIVFPTERYYALESARRWITGHDCRSLARVASQVVPFIGVFGWPIFRLVDLAPMASSMVFKFRR